jgi:hypothetical protein
LNVNDIGVGPRAALWFGVSARREDAMETLMTVITVTAGMAFSLAIAILVEELIFGKVFGLFFVGQAVRVKSEQER